MYCSSMEGVCTQRKETQRSPSIKQRRTCTAAFCVAAVKSSSVTVQFRQHEIELTWGINRGNAVSGAAHQFRKGRCALLMDHVSCHASDMNEQSEPPSRAGHRFPRTPAHATAKVLLRRDISLKGFTLCISHVIDNQQGKTTADLRTRVYLALCLQLAVNFLSRRLSRARLSRDRKEKMRMMSAGVSSTNQIIKMKIWRFSNIFALFVAHNRNIL